MCYATFTFTDSFGGESRYYNFRCKTAAEVIRTELEERGASCYIKNAKVRMEAKTYAIPFVTTRRIILGGKNYELGFSSGDDYSKALACFERATNAEECQRCSELFHKTRSQIYLNKRDSAFLSKEGKPPLY